MSDMLFLQLIEGSEFRVGDAGEIALRIEEVALAGPVELRGIEGAREIGHEHPVSGAIAGDADPFHQMRDEALRLGGLGIDGGAGHRIATGRVAAVRPIEHAILQIEFEIDRLRQIVEEDLDVRAIGRGLAFGNFEPGAQQEALLAVVGPLLRPVDLLAHGIDGYPDAPSGLVASVGVASARLDQRFDQRAVEVRAHDAHPLAVAPVQLAVLLIEMHLLWSVRAADRDDGPAIAAVEICALDRAVVGRDTEAHVGPVEMAGLDVDRDAVRKTTVGDDDLPLGAVGPHRVDAAGAHLEDEQTADRGLAVGGGFRFGNEILIHVLLLCERALTRRARAGRGYAAGVDFLVLLKSGARFSRNAANASFASLDLVSTLYSLFSSAIAALI